MAGSKMWINIIQKVHPYMVIPQEKKCTKIWDK